jgi:hypothetical protein
MTLIVLTIANCVYTWFAILGARAAPDLNRKAPSAS